MNNQPGFVPVGAMWSPVGAIPSFNDVLNRDGFYLSYNRLTECAKEFDHGAFPTTCLRIRGVFFVLLGDPRKWWAAASDTLVDAVGYFADHLGEVSFLSDHRHAAGVTQADPLETRQYALAAMGEETYAKFCRSVRDSEG